MVLDMKGREFLKYTVQSVSIDNNKYLRYYDFIRYFGYMEVYLQFT